MKRKIKIIGVIASFLAVIILISILFIYFKTKNIASGKLEIDGIGKRVIVNRDQYGIPHIEAGSDKDAFFALGFIHAQDRMWQMEMQRHISQGSLSEMFGEVTLSKDKFLRTLGFYRAAKSALPALSTETKEFIHSYTQGINYFITTGNLPLQFKLIGYTPTLWNDVDSIAFQKMMAWDLNNTWQDKVQNYTIASLYGKDKVPIFMPQYPSNAPLILKDKDLNMAQLNKKELEEKFNQPDKIQPESKHSKNEFELGNVPGKGSNNWVVSGLLTDTNKPMLANDPHLSLGAPILWYLADIKTPNFHSIGATIPGLPGIVIGHNQHIAWGVTNGCIDAQDLYIEAEDSKLTTIQEVIKVKGKPDVVFPVHISKHGPIISDITSAGKVGKRVALKWIALEPNDTTMQSFLQISYAHNWNDFRNALKYYIGPSQNFVYADKQGNVGYYLSGKIPIRNGWSGTFPIDSRDNLEWNDYIPFEKMPHVLNPSDGYIITANNKIVSDNYPYNLTFRCKTAPYRAERIHDLMEKKNKLSKADLEEIQNDTFSYLWKDLRPELLITNPTDEPSIKALVKLKSWDGNMSTKSEAATIFTYWFKELSKMVPEKIQGTSKWPEPLFLKQQLKDNGEYCKTKDSQDCPTFLSNSLKNAIVTLAHEQSTNEKNWDWGNVHKAFFKDLGLGDVRYLSWIWNRNIPTAGDGFTVNVGSFDFNSLNQIAGPGYRQIVDLNNFDNSVFIQALGQSNNVFSKNYDNLMPLWRDGKYIPMSSSKELWGKYETLILEPKQM
jgi:penicillin G amidase